MLFGNHRINQVPETCLTMLKEFQERLELDHGEEVS